MKLSIICLNYSTDGYNTAPNYDISLQKLFEHPIDYDFEVILVDNGSPRQDQLTWLRNRWEDKVTFVALDKNYGYHDGNEAGFKIAKGEYLLTLNPDTEIQENTINLMLEYMDNTPNVGILGPQLIYPDGVIQDSYRRFMNITDQVIKRLKILHTIPYFKKRMFKFLMWNENPNEELDVDWMIGGFMMFRGTALQEIDGFDNRYFLFMGDTDVCREMWKHGWRVVYYPKAKATHQKSRLSGNSLLDAIFKKTFWIHIADTGKYFLKWGLSSKRPKAPTKKN